MSKAVKCPVCGQTELVDDGDVCDVCKWFHDRYQEEFPDEEDCENRMSLNQARAAWTTSESSTASCGIWKRRWITMNLI